MLGYTGPTEEYKNRKKWMKDRHQWDIETDWIINTAGVVPAVFNAVRNLQNRETGHYHHPVYYPFFMAIKIKSVKS